MLTRNAYALLKIARGAATGGLPGPRHKVSFFRKLTQPPDQRPREHLRETHPSEPREARHSRVPTIARLRNAAKMPGGSCRLHYETSPVTPEESDVLLTSALAELDIDVHPSAFEPLAKAFGTPVEEKDDHPAVRQRQRASVLAHARMGRKRVQERVHVIAFNGAEEPAVVIRQWRTPQFFRRLRQKLEQTLAFVVGHHFIVSTTGIFQPLPHERCHIASSDSKVYFLKLYLTTKWRLLKMYELKALGLPCTLRYRAFAVATGPVKVVFADINITVTADSLNVHDVAVITRVPDGYIACFWI